MLLQPFLQELTSRTKEDWPRRRNKAVGPMGWPAGHPMAPTAPKLLLVGLSGPPLVQKMRHNLSSLVLLRFFLHWFCFGSWATLGLFEPESML